MKKCTVCKKGKKLSDFYPSRTKGSTALNPMCILCQGEYHSDWYQKNKKKVIARARARTKEVKDRNEILLQKLKDCPCADCTLKYAHWIMQFDHVRGKKKDDLCKMKRYASTEEILEEAAKCEVVCANCHSNRTHLRRIGKWPAPSGTV